jgi:alcohol dehydrogenase
MGEQVFSYFMPPVSLMGAGSAKQAGDQVKNFGKKALIVTDAFLAKSGMADEIAGHLKNAGIDVAVFGGAEPNPTDNNVHDGLKFLSENKCDVIVSLGGGSAHDCAKGIGIVAGNGGNIRDYEGVDKMIKPCLLYTSPSPRDRQKSRMPSSA